MALDELFEVLRQDGSLAKLFRALARQGADRTTTSIACSLSSSNPPTNSGRHQVEAVAIHVEARAIYRDWDQRTRTLPVVGFTVDESGYGQALILTFEGNIMPAATNAGRDWEFERIDIASEVSG